MKATILALFLSATGALAAPVAEPEAEAAGAQKYEHYGNVSSLSSKSDLPRL